MSRDESFYRMGGRHHTDVTPDGTEPPNLAIGELVSKTHEGAIAQGSSRQIGVVTHRVVAF